MIDWNTIGAIANILVAIGTLILSIVTWITIRLNKKQMAMMHKQVTLAINEKNPVLQIESFHFKNDSLHLKIKNIGGGNAYRIGIVATFTLAQANLHGYNKDKQPEYFFSVDVDKIVDVSDEKEYVVARNGYVNYISKGKKNVVILQPNELVDVEIIPNFDLEYKVKNLFEGTSGRNINIDQLKELLKNNNKNLVHFSFHIICKNSIDDYQYGEDITDFIMDVTHHKNLEDAYKDGLKFQLNALDQDKMETKRGGMNYYSYKNSKSMKNYNPYEEPDWDSLKDLL